MDLQALASRQQAYFDAGHTRPVAFRRAQLQKLTDALHAHEQALTRALEQDLGKAPVESYLSEIGMIYAEARELQRHLGKWARPQRVSTPLANFPGQGRIYPEPYGRCLILAPWNYPALLSLQPLVGALAAGNCAVLKPSEYAPHTARVLEDILTQAFAPEYVAVVQGGPEVSQALCQHPFDLIFYTGGGQVGRKVMAAAAQHLTPVILELGGKSPCIVDQTADLALAARRIVWGKFLNAGQTCVAPDYLLVHQNVFYPLLDKMREAIATFYGPEPLQNPDYPKIISPRHFERLTGLLAGCRVLAGGQADPAACKIAPTLLGDVDLDSPIMREEIFGPLLPVLPYANLDAAFAQVRSGPKPLAAYCFTQDKSVQQRFLRTLSFGGGCINDTVMHLASPALPFGGVGESGMGAYHGKASFEAFTHRKGVLKKGLWPDIPLRYPPYTEKKLGLIRRVMK